MDSSLKQLFLSLLGLLALSSLFTTTNGAERFFFSKMLRAREEPSSIPTNFPPSESGHGYGLYGRTEQFGPTTSATTVKYEQNIPSTIPDEKPKPMNENYVDQYNKKQAEIERTNNNPNEFSDESTEGRYELNNNNYDQKRRDWQYQHKYGMSNTRLMDNGRYYYNMNSKRYDYPFESNTVRTNSEEYGLAGVEGRKGRVGNEAYGYANENEYNKNGMNGYIP